MASDLCSTLHAGISNLILLISCIICLIGIFSDYNAIQLGGPLVEVPLFILAASVLFLNEGYQVAILGVRYFQQELMQQYPHAKKVRSLIFSHDYDRLPRLFLGQSFLVVTSTFLISGLTTFIDWPSEYFDGWNLPEWAITLLFRSGIPSIVVCVNLFQLVPSLYGQRFPRELLESLPSVYHTIITALFIESMGILHCTFLIVDVLDFAIASAEEKWETGNGNFGSFPSQFSQLTECFSTVTSSMSSYLTSNSTSTSTPTTTASDNSDGRSNLIIEKAAHEGVSARGGSVPTEETEETEEVEVDEVGAQVGDKKAKPLKFKVKVICSTLMWFCSFFYIMYSLFHRRSLVDANPIVLVLVLGFTFALVWYCEGLKIAICGTAHMSNADLEARGYTTALHDILNQAGSDGTTSNGISRFLLGRQLIVVPLNFIIANIFSFQGYEDIPVLWYELLIGFSLPCVLFTIQLIQLAPQVFAGRHTGEFLSLPGAANVVKFALMVERLGLTKPAHGIVDALSARDSGSISCGLCFLSNQGQGHGQHSSNKWDTSGGDVPLGLNASESGKDDAEYASSDANADTIFFHQDRHGL